MFYFCRENAQRAGVLLGLSAVSVGTSSLMAAGHRKLPTSSVHLEQLGCGLTAEGTVGQAVVAVDFQSDLAHAQGQAEVVSEKSCNFQSSMTRASEQFSGFLVNDVELALQQAYEKDCRRGSVTTFVAVIDQSDRLNVRDQLGVDATLINTAQNLSGDFDAIAAWRQNIGSEVIMKVHHGFIAGITVEFEFQSMQDIRKLSAAFSATAGQLFDVGDGNNADGIDREGAAAQGRRPNRQIGHRASGNRNASITAKIAAEVVNSSINGSYRVRTFMKGRIAGMENLPNFPLIQSSPLDLTGNVAPLLDDLVRFNSWARQLPLHNVEVTNSCPILIDTVNLHDLKIYSTPIAGLLMPNPLDDHAQGFENCSLARVDSLIMQKMARVALTQQGVLGGFAGRARGRDERLCSLLEAETGQDLIYLIRNRVSVDSLGSTLLHWAAIYDVPQFASFIIQHGGREILDVRDIRGRTALMRAAQNGSESVARILLDSGAQVNLIDRDGKTAYTYATDLSSKGAKEAGAQAALSAASAALVWYCPPAGVTAKVLEKLAKYGKYAHLAATSAASGAAAGFTESVVSAVQHPDRSCDCGWLSCPHSRIGLLLRQRGADRNMVASSYTYVNRVGSVLATPNRVTEDSICWIFGREDRPCE